MALSHMVVGLLLLHCLKLAKLINYSPFDLALARKALPVSLCFIANCVLGMVALKGTNIPMFATLRRLTIMMVVMCEVIIIRKKQTMLIILSVSVMILGSFIGGWGDLQFDAFGYSMVLLNNLVTALNLVFIKKTLMETKLATDTFGVLYYNSLLSIPFLLILALITGELSGLSEYPYLLDSNFQTSFFMSAFMSFLMNYSTYWCTEVNSALTTSVTGQVKNVLSSFVSVTLFTTPGVGVQATPMLVTGLTVGLIGSAMYAYAVYKQDANKQKKVSNDKSATNDDNIALLSSTPSSKGSLSCDTTGSSIPLMATPKYTPTMSSLSDKFHRLEAGQRSPMVAPAPNSNSTMLLDTNGTIGRSSMTPLASPNPNHPHNNPHKSKPN